MFTLTKGAQSVRDVVSDDFTSYIEVLMYSFCTVTYCTQCKLAFLSMKNRMINKIVKQQSVDNEKDEHEIKPSTSSGTKSKLTDACSEVIQILDTDDDPSDYKIFYPAAYADIKVFPHTCKCPECDQEFPSKGTARPIEYYEHCIKECPKYRKHGEFGSTLKLT